MSGSVVTIRIASVSRIRMRRSVASGFTMSVQSRRSTHLFGAKRSGGDRLSPDRRELRARRVLLEDPVEEIGGGRRAAAARNLSGECAVAGDPLADLLHSVAV